MSQERLNRSTLSQEEKFLPSTLLHTPPFPPHVLSPVRLDGEGPQARESWGRNGLDTGEVEVYGSIILR